MSKKKLIIITVTAVAVTAGGTFGAYKLNERRKTGKAVAEVTPVSYMTGGYYGGDLELNGTISSGNTQNVMADNTKLIEQVLVKEGDSVKKGDPLIKYDITALELNLKQKEIAVSTAESNIITANKELKKLKNLKPSESMPKPPEPEIPTVPEPVVPEKPIIETKDAVNTSADSFAGDGSRENPFMFNCKCETVISGVFFDALKQLGGYAIFMVYENNELLYQWHVLGTDIKSPNPEDIKIGSIAAVNQVGDIIILGGSSFGSFIVPKPEDTDIIDYTPEPEPFDYEQYYENFYNSIPKNYDEDYTYTKAEIAKMVSEKESQIKALEIAKKAAELEFRIAQEQKESGAVTARIDGVVSKINDGENQEQGKPYLVVSGGGGMTVKGYVGEMNLDKVAPGTIINVMSWETGESAEAEVTEIGTVPVSYSSWNWNENPNSSTYEFTASVSGMTQIPNDPYVSITLPSQEESQGLVIPKVYVREGDDGSYVFKADENNRLKKQYVSVGKTIYGSQVEILGGLTREDKISFPYGKNLKEGIKTKDSDEVLW